MKDFYPWITEETLTNTVSFSENHVPGTTEHKRIMNNIIVVFNKETWKKKETKSSFDATIKTLGGGKFYELVGIFIHYLLTALAKKESLT